MKGVNRTWQDNRLMHPQFHYEHNTTNSIEVDRHSLLHAMFKRSNTSQSVSKCVSNLSQYSVLANDSATQRKKNMIEIKDPQTGKDVIKEFLKERDKKKREQNNEDSKKSERNNSEEMENTLNENEHESLLSKKNHLMMSATSCTSCLKHMTNGVRHVGYRENCIYCNEVDNFLHNIEKGFINMKLNPGCIRRYYPEYLKGYSEPCKRLQLLNFPYCGSSYNQQIKNQWIGTHTEKEKFGYRDFLLQLQYSPLAKQKPEGLLPDVEITPSFCMSEINS